jgi:2,3-bisphosphoglycerate-dependent phosphoglycerate mutase
VLTLAQGLEQTTISAVYSSPYARAIQTVRPLAQSRSLEVQTINDFREHALAGKLLANWRESLEMAWKNFDHRFVGGDTMRETQARGWNALEKIRLEHPTGTVAIGGHGTIFSLILNTIEPQVDCEFHLAMPKPAVYTITHDHGWQVISGPGI